MTTFTWRTHEGEDLRPSQMDTLHLFHTVKMLWNHTVPDEQQIKPFRQWSLYFDADERKEAMKEMLAELKRRTDKSALTSAQMVELCTIRLKDKVWKAALKDMENMDDDGWPYGCLDQWDLF